MYHGGMSKKRKDPGAVKLGRKGGQARRITMTDAERSASAKLAAEARWKRVREAEAASNAA